MGGDMKSLLQPSQYAGLRAAIATHQQWGSAQERYQQICQLSYYLWQRLTELTDILLCLDCPTRTGACLFQLTSNKRQLVKFLETQSLMTPDNSRPRL